MSILSQNPPKVLYFSSFLYFTQREIQLASHMIQPDLETSDNRVFFGIFFVFFN